MLRLSRVAKHANACLHASLRTMSSVPGMGSISPLDRLMRVKPALEDKPFKTWYGDMKHSIDYDNEVDENDKLEGEDGEELDLDEQEPLYQVGKQLMKLGRVPYHHMEDMPDWLSDRLAMVCSHRTSPQIRRCLKDWMIKSDREEYTKYRSKRLFWRKQDKDKGDVHAPVVHAYGPDETVAYAHYYAPSRFGITRRVFREVRTLLPSWQPTNMLDFGCGPATAGAAAVDVWGKQEAETRGWKDDKLSPQAWRREHQDKYKSAAAVATLPALSQMKYSGVDVSQSMLDSGKVLLQGTLPKATFWDKIGDVVKRSHATGERFDLINVSYTLSELSSDPMRRAAVMLLFELLDVGGSMVIIENGSPVGSHTVRTARQLILDTFGTRDTLGRAQDDDEDEQKGGWKHKAQSNLKHGKGGAGSSKQTEKDSKLRKSINVESFMLSAPHGLSHEQVAASVVAPCTHDRECPLREGFWCSFSQKVHSGKIRKGNEEKFSYVVLRKIAVNGAAAAAAANADDDNSSTAGLASAIASEGDWTSVTTRAVNTHSPSPLQVLRDSSNAPRDDVETLLHQVDWETYTPPLYREEWGRILRSPIKKKGHILMDVCQSDGTASRATLTRATVPQGVPALYSALRKISWGGLYPNLQEGAGGVRTRSSAFSQQQVHDMERITSPPSRQGGTSGGGDGDGMVSSLSGRVDLTTIAQRKAAEKVLQTFQKEQPKVAKEAGIGALAEAAAAGGRRRARAAQGASLRALSRRRKELRDESD